jgi:Gpi18-like mannosyltransferase
MQDRFSLRQQILLLALFFGVVALLLPKKGAMFDLRLYAAWIQELLARGIGPTYVFRGTFVGAPLNYLPVMVYLFNAFGWWLGSGDQVDSSIHLLKLVVFVFDLSSILLVMRLLERYGWSPLRAFFILFNIAFLYNTLIWGQTDSILVTFVFGALLMAALARVEIAAVFTILVLNVKPQALIYLPMLLVLLLPSWFRVGRRLPRMLAPAALAQLYFWAPFLYHQEIARVLAVVPMNIDFFPRVSMHAYNFWYLVLSRNPYQIRDAALAGGLTFKTWGILLFLCFALVVLVPFTLHLMPVLWRGVKLGAAHLQLVWLTAALLTLGFFFFNTQMHERYSYPAVLFLGVYALLARDFLIYILVSAANFLNEEGVLGFFGAPAHAQYALLFSPQVIALLFVAVMGIGLLRLYQSSRIAAQEWLARRPFQPPRGAADA